MSPSIWRTAPPSGQAHVGRRLAGGLPRLRLGRDDCEQAPRMLNDRHVVVVDEAGMADTRRLARVVAYAEGAGAKVVLVGDHHQLPAVEAGGALRGIVARHGAVELTENRRQVEAWERATLAQLRTGAGGRDGIVEVVARYDGRGRLHVGTTPAAVREAMVADWHEARQAGEHAVMLGLRRADVAELNARARALLVADGSVAREGTAAAGRTFAIGDRVVCLHNDRRVGVHNALVGTVIATDSDGLVLELEGSKGPRLASSRPGSSRRGGGADPAGRRVRHAGRRLAVGASRGDGAGLKPWILDVIRGDVPGSVSTARRPPTANASSSPTVTTSAFAPAFSLTVARETLWSWLPRSLRRRVARGGSSGRSSG